MATLLALGIPGGSATAVMLGAFAMHNITGGSRFMTENMDIVYSIILGNFAQTILLFVVGIGFVFVSSSIVRVPLKYLVPTVFALAILGAFSLTGNMVGPITVFVFAVIGWFMRRFDYPVAAMVIGLLLGRMAEGELLRSYQLSGGSLAYLLDRPIALVIMALLILSLVYPLIKKSFNRS
jgi:putative tricarboxylic transport membrane protein